MNENKQEQEIADKLSEAQLKKLNLEIESLELKNSWDRGWARYISSITILVSVITAFVAVAGFWLSINKYFNDREQERNDREQERIAKTQAQRLADEEYFRTTFNQVLELVNAGTRNGTINSQSDAPSQSSRTSQHPDGLYGVSSSEVSMRELLKLQTLLEDLNSVVVRLPKEYKTRVTNMLIDSINGLSFANTHNIEVDMFVIQHWEDYKERLKADEKTHDISLDKYIVALQEIHDKEPQFFKSMKVDPKSSQVYFASNYNEESLAKFIVIVRGFKLHMKIMEHNPEGRKDHIKMFQDAIDNQSFTEQFFYTP